MTDAKTQKRPVIALMGEFSAGKSTLANLLLGAGHSPVKVTATQLPPVWFSYGSGPAIRVGLDGSREELPLGALETVSVDDTAHVRIFLETELLEIMDLIDMPGISDPNMAPEVWKRALQHADGAIWCTHATQAWRQSEAAVWEEVGYDIADTSILLLTRFDKILNDKDRARVVRRVETETAGQFRGVYPISLLQAMQAGTDGDAWARSGADAFLNALMEIVLGVDLGEAARPEREAASAPAPRAAAEPIPLHREARPQAAAPSSGIMPRRVAAKTPGEGARTARPA